jgi:ABC-2 type transport system ATP-binding protein
MVQRESIFRLELDALDGGPVRLTGLPGVVRAVAATDGGGNGEAQTVAVNLVLEDDAALGGVVGALGGLGAQILALRKSEPTLEDVFVELVGRGFGEAPDETNGAAPPGRAGDGGMDASDEETVLQAAPGNRRGSAHEPDDADRR